MLMADKYGSILNPYYIIYIYIYIYMGPTSSNNWNNINDVILTYVFYWAALGFTGLFCNFTDLEFVSVHENTENKELGK